MKDELYEEITKELFGLRAKSYSYVIDNGSVEKRAKSTKKCAINENLKLKTLNIFQKQFNLKKKSNRKTKFTTDSLKENHEEFIKHNSID